MATTKKRINISVAKETEEVLKMLSKRDEVPQATKAGELLSRAILLEEDNVLNKMAEDREEGGSKLLSHEKVWK